MKKIFCSLFLMLAAALSANSQWEMVNVPHPVPNIPYDVEVPNDQTVWAALLNSSTGEYTPFYYRTADGGANWDFDTVKAPAGYKVVSLAAIDADTCYALMTDFTDYNGGGIFKTTNGGKKWKQLAVGQVFDSASFPDIIYFWNPQQGIAIGDANGPGNSYMEIYTTNDYGKTWQRTPRANLPQGTLYGITNNYYVVGDRMWFQVVGDNVHQVWRSDDRGKHWQAFPINNFPNGYSDDIAFTDSLKGVVVGFDTTVSAAFVCNTKDGGKTWSKPLHYSGSLLSDHVEGVPGTNRLISAGAFGGYWGSSYSDDNGKTWTLIDNWPHGNLKFLNSTVGWSGLGTGDASNYGGMFKWVGPCGKPTHVTAHDITSSSAKIKWNSVPGAAKYTLQGRVHGTTTWTTKNVTDTFYVVHGLAAGTTYEYRVKAVCDVIGDASTGYTPIAAFTTTAAFADNMVAGKGPGTITGTTTISPNPAQNAFVLQLNSSMNGKVAIIIIDPTGKHVLSETRNASAGLNKFSVDISGLSRGIYLVQIETNDQKVVKKLVKQ